MRVMVIGVRAPDERYQSDDTACIDTADPNAKRPLLVQYRTVSTHTSIIIIVCHNNGN